MPKFLIHFTYTSKALDDVVKEGGSVRREAARELVESLGGRLEAYYFAFGSYDGIALAELPDNTAMVALAGTIAGTGTGKIETTVLITPEEVDDAMTRSATYRPAGH